ncbi:BON domain-containing protein [Chitinimonas sp. PSY-7]|uniref:BON domain-containing protein n=1 Tax=Chitinimonas sp. PSY-7 TaxID=3459088 RepID=UPI00403FD003
MKLSNLFATSLTAVVLLLGITACDSNSHLPHVEDTADAQDHDSLIEREIAAAAAVNAADKMEESTGDAALTSEIKAALVNDAGVGTLRLGVVSNDGVVTLSGSVPTAQESETCCG